MSADEGVPGGVAAVVAAGVVDVFVAGITVVVDLVIVVGLATVWSWQL